MDGGDDAVRLLGGRYELHVRIGAGGAGAVWRGHDRILDRPVAIKLLHSGLEDGTAAESRFRLEATAAAKLTHPHAVQVYDVGHDGVHYLVMELLAGPSLADLLADGPLPVDVAAALGVMIAEALGAAHDAGIVHRDVKPGNVLFTREGRPKLADFGVARVLDASSARLTRTGAVLGTARYLAPEQLRDGDVDARADVYALGVVLHEAVTGRLPFGHGTLTEIAARRLTSSLPAPAALIDGVPEAFDAVIAAATSADPAERPENGHTLAAALRDLARPDPEPALAARLGDTTTRTPSPASDRDDAPDPTRATSPRRDDHHGPRRASRGDDTRPFTLTEDPLRPSPPPPPADGRASPAPTRTATNSPRPAAAGTPPAGRWALGAVAALVVLVGGLMTVNTFVDRAPAGAGDGGSLATIDEVGDHDPPPGDRDEHGDDATAAIDGDPETFWQTETYTSADLGGLKDGVGLWVTLTDGGGHLEIAVSRTGGHVEVWTGQGAPAPEDQPAEWGERVAERAIDDEVVRLDEVVDTVAGDVVLLWFTALPATGDGFRAEVREIRIVED